MGYPLDRFNNGEAGLRREIPPAIVKLVADYWTEADVHEEIESFDKGSLQCRGMSRLRSTVASFSGFTQRIRRRQFVDEKLWSLLVGTPLNFGKLPVEDYREPSRRALGQATARLFDEACKVLQVSSYRPMRT